MKLRLLWLLLLATGSAFAQSSVTVDETARFLAGLPVEGPLAPLMATPGWQQHAREMDEAWAKKQAQQILPIRNWMSRSLSFRQRRWLRLGQNAATRTRNDWHARQVAH